MTKIKLMNKIAAVGTDIFDRAAYEIGENFADSHIIVDFRGKVKRKISVLPLKKQINGCFFVSLRK